MQNGKAGNHYSAWLGDLRFPANSLISMCLNNHVDIAVENNPTFEEGAGEIGDLPKSLYLLRNPVCNTFSGKCLLVTDVHVHIRRNASYLQLLMATCNM